MLTRPHDRTRRRSATKRVCAIAIAMVTGLVTFTATPAFASTGDNYVALGDSYSAGVGAGSYTSDSGNCLRSTNAYSQLWADSHSPASYVSVACSGATTQDVLNNQLSALSSSTTLVTMTIGGNDVGFSSVMQTCVLDSTSACLNAVNNAESEAQSILPGRLANLYSAIQAAAPNAVIVVLGYPEFYDLANSWYCAGLSTDDRSALNNAADTLDTVIENAATSAGIAYADVRGNFSGHELCDLFNEWLHAVNVTDLTESYHPTASGQSGGYLPALESITG